MLLALPPQVVADVSYPDQYVLAVMEKTGGMPLYIEKVTEFLCQKPWLAESGGEFAANVNKMISNLNFQQVGHVVTCCRVTMYKGPSHYSGTFAGRVVVAIAASISLPEVPPTICVYSLQRSWWYPASPCAATRHATTHSRCKLPWLLERQQ